ncbi:hypothetical protein ACFX1X_020661 [Malus domestica]
MREGRFEAKYVDNSHKCKGLKALAMEFLHKHTDKSKDVTLSRLDVHKSSTWPRSKSSFRFAFALKSSFRFAFARHAAAVDEGLLTSMPDACRS